MGVWEKTSFRIFAALLLIAVIVFAVIDHRYNAHMKQEMNPFD